MRAMALALALLAGPAVAAGLALDARVVWNEDDPDFGGLSGFVLSDAGRRLLAISDRGTWISADLTREDGTLTGAHRTGGGPLKGIEGKPLNGIDIDAEGLAVDGRGRIYISYEAFHRVRVHARIDGPARDVPSHPDFASLQNNSGLEALAVDAAGTLYAIPERSEGAELPFAVYRLRGGVWDKTLRVPRSGGFLVTDADIGPDGALYLLERDFGWVFGFATRVRRFAITDEGLADEETLLETRFGELDNMEGMAVWRDPQGATRVTLISDDNFFPLQQTLLVEYLLTP